MTVVWQPLITADAEDYVEYRRVVAALHHYEQCATRARNDPTKMRRAYAAQDRWLWRAICMDDAQKYSDDELAQSSTYAALRGDLPRAFELAELPDATSALVLYNNWWESDAERSAAAAIAKVNPVAAPHGNSAVYRLAQILMKSLPHPCSKRALGVIVTKHWEWLNADGTPPQRHHHHHADNDDDSGESLARHKHELVTAIASEIFFTVRRILVATLLGLFPRATVVATFPVRYEVYRKFLWRGGCTPRQLTTWIHANEEKLLSALREFLFFSVDNVPPLYDMMTYVYYWASAMRCCVRDADARRQYFNTCVALPMERIAAVGVFCQSTTQPRMDTHVLPRESAAMAELLQHGPRRAKRSLLSYTLRILHKLDVANQRHDAVARAQRELAAEWRRTNVEVAVRRSIRVAWYASRLRDVATDVRTAHRHRILMTAEALSEIVPLDSARAARVTEAQLRYVAETNRPGLEVCLQQIRDEAPRDYVTLRLFYMLCVQEMRGCVVDLPTPLLRQQVAVWHRLNGGSSGDTDTIPPYAGTHYFCRNCGRLDVAEVTPTANSIVPLQWQKEAGHGRSSMVLDVSRAALEAFDRGDVTTALANSCLRCYYRKDRRNASGVATTAPCDNDTKGKEEEDDEESDDDDDDDDDTITWRLLQKQSPKKSTRSRRSPLAKEMTMNCGEDAARRVCLFGRQLVINDVDGVTRVYMLCPHCLGVMRYTRASLHAGTISCGCVLMGTTHNEQQQQQQQCFICGTSEVTRRIVAWDEERGRLCAPFLCQSRRRCVFVRLELWRDRLITLQQLMVLRDQPHMVPLFRRLDDGTPIIVACQRVDEPTQWERAVRRAGI